MIVEHHGRPKGVEGLMYVGGLPDFTKSSIAMFIAIGLLAYFLLK